MTMIESVSIRHRGAFDFETHYDNLCALQNSCPIVAVKNQLAEGILDVNGDRIRATDWVPILNTLKINKTLSTVAIHSTYQQALDEQDRRGMTAKKKVPAMHSKEITYRLCKAFKECMCVTPALITVKVHGLLLRERDLTTFAKGLAKNKTIKHLSFQSSPIGDEGLDIICRGMKNATSITSLDFTDCNLAANGAETLSKVIKHSAMRRHNDAWQGSLRYRRPDLDRMPGIRRITLNCNPMVGDQGAAWLAEALKDDLWLKALDMQQCGIGNVGANSLLDVIKLNTTIVVLDIRQNDMIDDEILQHIMDQVMINTSSQDKEIFKWMSLISSADDSKQKARKRRLKTLQTSFGKKATIRVSGGSGRRRSRSVGPVVPRAMQPFTAESVKPGPGMPWRTALRAGRYRGYPPDSGRDDVSMTSSTASTPRRYDVSSDNGDMLIYGRRNLSDSEVHLATRNVKVELEQLRRRLHEETVARSRAEERVIELTVENSRLQQCLLDRQPAAASLQDESVLQSIEGSFQQFNAFLDLLRGAGLGELINLVGIDQSKSPFGKVAPLAAMPPNRPACRRDVAADFDSVPEVTADVFPTAAAPPASGFDDLYRRCLADGVPPLDCAAAAPPGGDDEKRHDAAAAAAVAAASCESSHRVNSAPRGTADIDARLSDGSLSDVSDALDINQLTVSPPGGDTAAAGAAFLPIRSGSSA